MSPKTKTLTRDKRLKLCSSLEICVSQLSKSPPCRGNNRKLKRLVLRIFEELCHGEYNDGKVAKDFGLSKATFSRFAGSRWTKSGSVTPDLWVNTAQVLSAHKDFKKVAVESGVLGKVEATLKDITLPQSGGKSQ